MLAALKSMLSAARPVLLTATERWTQWSSLAYCLIGLTMFFSPSLWGRIWKAEFVGRTEGYMQLGGLGLAIEGYLLVAAARSLHKVTGHGHINITVVTRLVLVNLGLWKLFISDLAPIRYIAFYAVLDNFLAGSIVLVWFYTEDGASVSLFFREILGVLFRFPRGHWSSVAVLFIGIAQFFGALHWKNAERLQTTFNLDPFLGYSFTFLSLFFSMNAAQAVLYIFNGQAGSRSFNMNCAFYRVAFQIPGLLFLAVTKKVESGLLVCLVCVEVAVAAFILVSLFKFDKKQTEQDERKGNKKIN